MTFRQRVLDFVDFDLTETLDFQQAAASGCVHRGDSVVTIGLELRDVGNTNAVRLDCVDVDDMAILVARSAYLAVMECALTHVIV